MLDERTAQRAYRRETRENAVVNDQAHVIPDLIRNLLLPIVAVAALLLSACDFQGPWEYYPHSEKVYGGIYTYGYILEGETPYVCFSKMYALDETSAENFDFYEYANVTVEGKFDGRDSGTVKLHPSSKPNCFFSYGAKGIAGEEYTLNAEIMWDSSGEMVTSLFKAKTHIPTGFSMKQVCIPQTDKSCKLKENAHDTIYAQGLEFPKDMNLYHFMPEYNKTLGGVLLALSYDNTWGGETMNTTLNKMFKGFVSKDSLGYTGMHMRDPNENYAEIGYYENVRVGGNNNLDLMFIPAMNIPLGAVTVYGFAADTAYNDYVDYVLESVDDPRVIPKSNIEGGMGVFAGMQKDSILLQIQLGDMNLYTDYIPYLYMKLIDCLEKDDDGKIGNTKFCRLNQDYYCNHNSYFSNMGELKWCYGPKVRQAMDIEYSNWDQLLPSDISEGDKADAYKEGLLIYCVDNDFESNSLADCSELKKDCLESTEKTDCMEYMWQWCADRDWDFSYAHCDRALVSRYYVEEIKSNIIENYVDWWCANHSSDGFCK